MQDWNKELIRILQGYKKKATGIFEVHKIYSGKMAGYGYAAYDYHQEKDKSYHIGESNYIVDDYTAKRFKINIEECCMLCNVAIIKGDE